MVQDVAIGTYTGGIGEKVSISLDMLNRSAIGIKMTDLTFFNYDNGEDVTTTNSVSDSVQISITGII